MKALITKQETKKYYRQYFMLYPIWVGLLFTFLILIVYLSAILIVYEKFAFNFYFLLIGFGLGILEAVTTILLTFKKADKRFTYFHNLNKQYKNDQFIPAIYQKGFLDNIDGVLIFKKNALEFKNKNLIQKIGLFEFPLGDINSYEIIQEQRKHWYQFLTLIKKQNVIIVKTMDNEYRFLVPSLNELQLPTLSL